MIQGVGGHTYCSHYGKTVIFEQVTFFLSKYCALILLLGPEGANPPRWLLNKHPKRLSRPCLSEHAARSPLLCLHMTYIGIIFLKVCIRSWIYGLKVSLSMVGITVQHGCSSIHGEMARYWMTRYNHSINSLDKLSSDISVGVVAAINWEAGFNRKSMDQFKRGRVSNATMHVMLCINS